MCLNSLCRFYYVIRSSNQSDHRKEGHNFNIIQQENASKQGYVCYSQKTTNVTEDHDHGTFLDSLFRRLILNKFAWTGDGGTLCIPANSNARL